MPGSRCTVKRLPSQNLTIYEASFPLTEISDLEPLRRAGGDAPIRFSWVLHNNQGNALEWSEATAVFPWWSNTGSFVPAQELYLAAQTPLGFTASGPVDPGTRSGLPAVVPRPVRPRAVRPRPVNPRPYRRPTPAPQPRQDEEVQPLPPAPSYTEPMSPSMLPPAAPPPGTPLPPSTPRD